MLLFKEKINYKLAGSAPTRSLTCFIGGFDPHIDANAWIFLSAAIAALRQIGSKAMYGHPLSLNQVCKLKILQHIHRGFINKSR
ncbi:hypothetical protein N7449_007071 [Penicillium cf. viridicatum]|uniref:Uncharacterized protein n=1 Tax=Penicillium cf. viridicatum TaxID=2972119 RepID=A0A9W9JHR6_9EURO|nr:hypothetical protein N7449_007071 [Penicillium cf. viridicatum]